MTEICIGVIQCPLGGSLEENVQRVASGVRDAAQQGANIVLPPELFEGPYFPQHEVEEAFALAHPVGDHPTLRRFQALASELGVVIPVSFFERAGQAYYNSVAIFDTDGTALGYYRKSHIPDGPGYEEKFYFTPGDTGFQVWDTRVGTIGVGICWDQWFPECARAMALKGAEVLLYPTAIGSEPGSPEQDTKDPWQRAMVGHSVCNAMPVAAANRTGVEQAITFYGSSFITNGCGDRVAEFGRSDEGVLVARFDRETLRRERAGWGFFRDRRPELYGALLQHAPSSED